MPDIRRATPEDVAALPEIERLAGHLFKTYPGEADKRKLVIGGGERYTRRHHENTIRVANPAGRAFLRKLRAAV